MFSPASSRSTHEQPIEALASRSNHASLDLNGMQYKKAAQLRLDPAVFAVRGFGQAEALKQQLHQALESQRQDSLKEMGAKRIMGAEDELHEE